MRSAGAPGLAFDGAGQRRPMRDALSRKLEARAGSALTLAKFVYAG
jgi:hypothetical protein